MIAIGEAKSKGETAHGVANGLGFDKVGRKPNGEIAGRGVSDKKMQVVEVDMKVDHPCS